MSDGDRGPSDSGGSPAAGRGRARDGSAEEERRSRLPEYQAAVTAEEAEVEAATGRPASPRLARHVIRLDDGHEVTLAVAGHGMPFVVVHGFMAEGFLYAQTLSRLVALGYKVVAIDTAGHGGTEVLPDSEHDLDAYVDLLERTLDHLGIRHAVLTGHSMGGRIVAELGAADPERAVALLLLDPILGVPWDRLVARTRLFPPLLGWFAARLLYDTAATLPFLGNREQVGKLLRLLAPTALRHVRQPWRILAPAVAVLRSGSSRPVLERIRRCRIPAVVVHGERDLVVPLATARDAAERADGQLVIVHGATHSWLLRDPETLPAVVQALADGVLGRAYASALAEHGVPQDASVDEIETAFYDPDALVLDLTPELRFEGAEHTGPAPRYRFSRVIPGLGRGTGARGVA